MNEKDNLKMQIWDSLMDRMGVTDMNRYYRYNLLPNLNEYNRADTVNMSPDEMNKFRHIAGSAQSSKDMGFGTSFLAGIGKEFKDLRRGDGFKETIYDWGNNMRGWKTHFQNPSLDGEELNDYVFNKYIKSNRK